MNRRIDYGTLRRLILPVGSVVGLGLAVMLSGAPVMGGEKTVEDQVLTLDQFTITVPAGWYVHDQNAAIGKPGPHGVIVFSPVDLTKLGAGSPGRNDDEVRNKFIAIDGGKIPSFFVERYAAEQGVTCAGGFTPAVRDKLLSDYKRSARGTGNWEVGTPKVEDVVVAGCQGMRVQLSSKILEGGEFDFLIYVVSDGKVMYDFTLRNRKDFFEKNRPIFDKAISTLKLAALSTK